MSFTLVLSPETYPWDGAKEQTFVGPELEVLARRDARVIVLPQSLGGVRASVPSNVEVDDSFAQATSKLKKAELVAHAARTTLVAEELLRRGRELRSAVTLKRLVEYAGRAHHAAVFARAWLRQRGLERERVVFASTWWGPVTTGWGLLARDLRALTVVSRAHGFDLYEERHTPAYLPCRHRAFALAHGVYPDSDMGVTYLKERFRPSTPVEVARLGVVDPKVSAPASTDGVLRVVTCSLQVAVKRLDLLVEGLARAGAAGRKVEWIHHGTGELQPKLEAQARALFPSNVTFTFAGYSTQDQLYRWYASHPVDVFCNVSKSEGTPVAMMEAIACGIPVMATRVGGNPEICRDGVNGVVVGANPSALELGDTLLRFGSPEALAWREGSKRVFAERYDAERNYRAWFDVLESASRSARDR
ncbi:MAG: glycosyltransferase [Myxococcaceae bacterium]